jgi:hypothetical protein
VSSLRWACRKPPVYSAPACGLAALATVLRSDGGFTPSWNRPRIAAVLQ